MKDVQKRDFDVGESFRKVWLKIDKCIFVINAYLKINYRLKEEMQGNIFIGFTIYSSALYIHTDFNIYFISALNYVE